MLATMAIEVAIAQFWNLPIVMPAPLRTAFIMCACFLIGLYYRYRHRDDSLRIFANIINLLVCGNFCIVIGSELSAYLSQPLGDKLLIYIDHLVGFDWMTHAKWVDAHPEIAQIFGAIYISWQLQFALLFPLLVFHRLAHAQRILMALFFSGMLTIILAAILPSLGAYIFYNIDTKQIHNMPEYAHAQDSLLLSMLLNQATFLSFPAAGIISFPSYHSAAAIVLMYSALPYRYLRVPSMILNSIMLFSTPFNGGHYLIDTIAGILIAILSIYLAERLLPREYGAY